VFKELGDDDATHLSAGVAYYSVFSVFPLLLGLLAISGTVFTSITLQEQFLDYVTESMPGSEEFVSKNIEELVRFRGALGICAILGLLWSGSSAFGAMSRAINRAWDVEKDRPFYVAKILHIIIALSVGILFLLSSFASVAIELLSNYSRDLGLPGHEFFLDFGLGNLMLKAVPWAITLAVFCCCTALSRIAKHTGGMSGQEQWLQPFSSKLAREFSCGIWLMLPTTN